MGKPREGSEENRSQTGHKVQPTVPRSSALKGRPEQGKWVERSVLFCNMVERTACLCGDGSDSAGGIAEVAGAGRLLGLRL